MPAWSKADIGMEFIDSVCLRDEKEGECNKKLGDLHLFLFVPDNWQYWEHLLSQRQCIARG